MMSQRPQPCRPITRNRGNASRGLGHFRAAIPLIILSLAFGAPRALPKGGAAHPRRCSRDLPSLWVRLTACRPPPRRRSPLKTKFRNARPPRARRAPGARVRAAPRLLARLPLHPRRAQRHREFRAGRQPAATLVGHSKHPRNQPTNPPTNHSLITDHFYQNKISGKQ